MTRVAPDEVRTVTCIGAGVIAAAGWPTSWPAATTSSRGTPPRTPSRGCATSSSWPGPRSPSSAWPRGLDRPSHRRARPRRCVRPRRTFVQESAPEDLELKRSLLADIDAATPPGVVISSSTSGYGMSEMQVRCAGADRTVVATPSTPPYLIPSSRSWAARRPSPDAVAWASAFFTHVASRSSRWTARCRGSSPTGCRRRCGARPCTWSPTARRRSSRSTAPSPTVPGCAGRSTVRC